MAPSNLWIPLVFIIFSGNAVRGNITWSSDSVHIRQGENVDVTCSATDVGSFDALQIDLEREDKAPLQIASNDVLGTEARNSGRYSVTMESDGEFVSIRLNIVEARGEDSGNLVCKTLEKEDRRLILRLSVDVPIKSVDFQVKDGPGEMVQVNNNAEFTMKEGQDTGLACVALMDGTVRPADLKLLLNGDDVTNMFDVTNEPLVVDVKDGFEVQTNEATASYITMHPHKKFDGKKLTCQATALMGYQEEANIFLRVFYAPDVTCKMIEYFAQLGKPIDVVCHVTSNPPANISYFYEFNDAEKDTDEHPLADQFRKSEEPVSGKGIRLRFNIHNVHDSHLGKYIIRAKNEYGEKDTEFYIQAGALEVDTEPATLPPTPPKLTTPKPTEKKILVIKEKKQSEEPKTEKVYEPEEPQASLDGSASAIVVSSTLIFILGLNHMGTFFLRR